MGYRETHFAARKTAPDIGDSKIDAFFAQSWALRRHDSIQDPTWLTGKGVEQDRDGSDQGVYPRLQ